MILGYLITKHTPKTYLDLQTAYCKSRAPYEKMHYNVGMFDEYVTFQNQAMHLCRLWKTNDLPCQSSSSNQILHIVHLYCDPLVAQKIKLP